MKITTLIENAVISPKLVGEHGLSIYIETADRKILFDTGQTGLFMQNARELNIDLSEVDILILSHGHYDHCGGLYPFLKINRKAIIYAKKDIFDAKYHGQSRFIGTPRHDIQLRNRLIYVEEITEIDKDVFIMPHIPIYNSIDTHFKGLYLKRNDTFIPDEFEDELFLAIRYNEQVNIITACSHRGITNICTTATDYFKLPVGLVLGGFHMKTCTTEQYVHITHYFRILQPESIGTCHCTGIDQYSNMRNDCDTHLFYNYSGNIVNIA